MNKQEQLQTIKENVPKVNNAGKKDGYDEGYTAGKAEGGNYYDEFWDSCQDSGNRVNYDKAFAGIGWNDTTFKPKYTMSPTNASTMFRASKITNLKKILADCGVELDFSKITNGIYCSDTFRESDVTDLGIVDVSSVNNVYGLFYQARKLVNVEKVILASDGSVKMPADNFSGVNKLKEIRFEGLIASSIGFKECPLSVDSMIDIIEHLKSNWAGEQSLTQTITFSDSCWNALENSGRKPADADENFWTWRDYIESHLGWITA